LLSADSRIETQLRPLVGRPSEAGNAEDIIQKSAQEHEPREKQGAAVAKLLDPVSLGNGPLPLN
jgi:hypothetical protein